MPHERLSQKTRRLRGIRPIRLEYFARIAYVGDVGDEDIIKLESRRVPIHAHKPESNNESAGLHESHKKPGWEDLKIDIENY